MSDLDLSQETRDRLHQARNDIDAGQPDTPKLTDDELINCLLDTRKAVIEGVYFEYYTRNEDLRELVEEWREVSAWGDREKMSRYQKGLKDADRDHANDLEELIENE